MGFFSQLDQRGSAVLGGLLIGGLTLTTTTYVMFNIVNKNSSLNKQYADIVNYRTGMESTLDYVKYAINNRWCLSPAIMQEADCNLTHPRKN